MIGVGLVYLGMFALAASMKRHATLLPSRWATASYVLPVRVAGWSMLLLSLLLALADRNWPLALITWLGLLPLAAGAIVLGLAFGTGWTRATAALSVVAVAAGTVLGTG